MGERRQHALQGDNVCYDITVLQEKKKSAELGYLLMKIFKLRKGVNWGKFNDCPLNARVVKRLVDSFENHVNCTDITAIEITVKKTWIQYGLKFKDMAEGSKVASLNELMFSEEGVREIGNNNLWVLWGKHHREAIHKYMSQRMKDRDAEKKTLRNVQAIARQVETWTATQVEQPMQKPKIQRGIWTS